MTYRSYFGNQNSTLGSVVPLAMFYTFLIADLSRTTCNVCNGPQFTVEEERTGLGGGFDERGTVEYKEREESDDEFDDLGRKKRKKLPYKKPMIAQSVPDPPSEPEEEEEDEEEEDDDDGDLSKYDLWGDPEEDKKKEEVKPTNGSTLKPINEKKASVLLDEKKKSRSRSRSRRRSRSRSKESSKKRSRRSRSSRFTMFGSDCTDLILLTF